MASNHTSNYNLSQWERTDQVRMEDFNADNAKIDAALKQLSSTITSHTGTLSRKGNCQFYTTSYVGDGTSGESNPIRLTFPGRPMLVFIPGSNSILIMFSTIFGAVDIGVHQASISGTVGSNYISWYSGRSVEEHLNNSGTTYRVLALLDVS